MKNEIFFLFLLFLFIGCKEDLTYTGDLKVNFISSEFPLNGNFKSIEGKEFGVFHASFDDSFAFEFDAIQVGTIENEACEFKNLLGGTYKVAFMEDPEIYKIVQVLPGEVVTIEFR